MTSWLTTREVPLECGKAALLVIDLQKYCALPGRGLLKDVSAGNPPEKYKYFLDRIYKTVVPNLQSLLATCRKTKGIDIIYTYIESLTKDGRDQSLDYKITGFNVPKGSPDAEIIDELTPQEDEILIPKTSCSVFCSTNIEYVLRNLGVTQLVVTGIVTNQCVESAVRDAADLGFLVTLVEDACAADGQTEHDSALFNLKGFARICSYKKVVDEINSWSN